MTPEARLVQDLKDWGSTIVVFQPCLRLVFKPPVAAREDILRVVESDGWNPIAFGRDGAYEISLIPRPRQFVGGIPT